MIRLTHRQYLLLGIFCVSLAARLAWVLSLDVGLIWADEKKYFIPAVALAEGRGFEATSFVPPGYPFFLSLIFRIFGPNYEVVRVLQCVLGAWTCLLVYGIGRRLMNAQVGSISAVILALYPPHIYLAGVLYTECFVTFGALLALWLSVRTPGLRAWWWGAVWTGLALGYTTLTRSTFMIWLPVIGLVWLVLNRARWRRGLIMGLVLVASWMAVIVPWMLRNYGKFGKPIPVSSGYPSMLWRANNLLARGDEWDRDLGHFHGHYQDIWNHRRSELSLADQRIVDEVYVPLFTDQVPRRAAEIGDEFLALDEVLMPHAIAYITSHPGHCLVLAGKRTIRFFAAFTGTNTNNIHTRQFYRLIAGITSYPIMILGLVGLVLGWKNRRSLVLLYLTLLAGVLFHSFVATATRLRLPLDPIVILFGAVTLDYYVQHLSRRLKETVRTDEIQGAGT